MLRSRLYVASSPRQSLSWGLFATAVLRIEIPEIRIRGSANASEPFKSSGARGHSFVGRRLFEAGARTFRRKISANHLLVRCRKPASWSCPPSHYQHLLLNYIQMVGHYLEETRVLSPRPDPQHEQQPAAAAPLLQLLLLHGVDEAYTMILYYDIL